MQVPGAPQGETQSHEVPWRDENRRLVELIACAKQGNLEAFADLYRSTARWLLSQVRRYVDDGQAEDVLAEVYVQVWQGLARFDETRAPPAVWLAVIARSRALDHLRREKSHGRAGAWLALQAAPAEEVERDGPEELLARAQQHRLVQLSLAVAPLNPEERLVLGLAYYRDSTSQEISLLTGLPLYRVRAVLNRAQDKLRQQLLGPFQQRRSAGGDQPSP